jgi:hydrogenase maturation factor
MCLTKPFKIEKIVDCQAYLTDGRVVDISLIDGVEAGDWVLVNANLAISRVSIEEAKEINNYFKKK